MMSKKDFRDVWMDWYDTNSWFFCLTSISVIMGWSTDLPPLNFILLIWLGLFLFLVRAIYKKILCILFLMQSDLH